MSLSKITYTDNVTYISAQNLNDIQDEILLLEKNKFNKSGGIFSGNIKFKSYDLVDSAGVSYPGATYDNGDLWIGSSNSFSSHHTGKTNISTGFNHENNAGRTSIYIAVPNSDNTSSTYTYAWHDGYVNCNKLYPVGSHYTMSTNTNPNTIFPRTSWSLVDKKFISKMGNYTDLFTIDTTNVSSLASCYAAYGGNTISLRIAITNKKAFSDTAAVIGTINFDKLGITQAGLTRYQANCYCDSAQGIPIFTISNTTGKVTITDINGPSPSTKTGINYYFTITYILPPSYMVNSFCNQFIWKRTA